MPSKTSRASAIFFVLFSLTILAYAEYERRYGTPPKTQLAVVTGRATNISTAESRVRYGGRVYHVYFTLGGITTEYASNRPGYQQLLAAIQSNQPLALAVSTKGGTLLQQYGRTPIYAAYVGSQPVVTYEQTATLNGQKNIAVFLAGGIALCIAIWRFSKTSSGSGPRGSVSNRGNFVGPRVR
ncbi:MAG TPA: hypothetical protein VK961_17915 [Chthoniobacter sp.]|nr:hypothetical protein [Chthoniobacter sp.]